MLKASPLVNWLFSVRWRLGKALGWDGERQQVGTRVESLRDQLPEDLRVRRGTDMELAPFRSVFLTDDEWTAEFSASIGHIVMHHGWVRGENGVRYSQMTSLVMRVRSRGQFCADADGDSFPATELACELLLRNHCWTDDCSSTTMDTW
jgi:hypothetical protein